MSTEDQIRPLLDQVVEIIRTNSFIPPYKATREECLGLAISKYLEWTGIDILNVCADALEDANYHDYADTLRNWQEELELNGNLTTR